MMRRTTLIILAFFTLAVCPAKAGANDYYVSTTGSDSTGAGTQASPWATIAHASTKISAGAVVHVAAGVYTGNFTTSASGTSSAPITYEGPVNCAQVTADHGSLSSCAQLVASTTGPVWYNTGNYVTISGFDITGPNIGMDIAALQFGGNYDSAIENSVHDISTLSPCNSNGADAIGGSGTSNDVADANYVYKIGPAGCAWVQGIYPSSNSTGWIIENNIVMEVASYGIQSWSNSGGDTIVDNTVVNSAGCVVLGTDTSGQTNGNDFVAGNICYLTPAGIQEQGYASSATGTNNVYADNLFYNCTTTYRLQNGLTGTGTVSADPLFVNYTGNQTGDYHLQATSPAIGASASTNAPIIDFDGNARPQGSAWDIGAYEYVSNNVTPVSAPSVSTISIGATATRLVGSPFAALPACSASTAGVEAFITDSTTQVWGAAAAGGGTNPAKVICDGVNWTVEGK